VASGLDRQPTAFGRMLCAADRQLGEQIDVVVAGPAASAEARSLREAAAGPYAPDLVITTVGEGDAHAEWPLFAGKAGARATTAYACRGYACLEPTTDPIRLGAQVAELGGPLSPPGS
jgi:uncharacterized protein YyaL (SSP411 family)